MRRLSAWLQVLLSLDLDHLVDGAVSFERNIALEVEKLQISSRQESGTELPV